MKLCTACSRELLKDHYSKKQWQLNQRQRRCKECIAGNREVRPVPLPPAGQGAKPEKGPKAKERRASRSSRAEGERGSLSDDDLFKPPLPMLDCPICFLPMPLDSTDSSTKCFYPCCGKTVCMGCVLVYVRQNDHRICPFCRTPEDASNEAAIERMKKRADAGDSDAMYNLGALYYEGQRGVREDPEKAFNLWSSAGRLGCAASNGRIGTAHMMGDCRVERDVREAKRHWELAAVGGDVASRYNLGILEQQAGDVRRAVRHFAISAGAGDDMSLDHLRTGYSMGEVTKGEFLKSLRSHKDCRDGMRSSGRDEAALWEAQRQFL